MGASIAVIASGSIAALAVAFSNYLWPAHSDRTDGRARCLGLS
jgi:hypothetical protein